MKILIVFGSSTGNTEELANTIERTLGELGHANELINIAETSEVDYSDYDCLLLGSSTWDEGQPQLDYRFHLEDLQSSPPNLEGKPFAVFGTGESCYEFFCGGVDKLEETYASFGGRKAHESLKIDTLEEDPVENERVVEWTQKVMEKVIPGNVD
jgi:flavodoxin I